MRDRRIHLKVKIKQLASEARDIRRETHRHSDIELKNSLYLHRVRDIRPIARLNLIAYGFIRGKKYHEIERNPKSAPDWEQVRKLVKRFGVCYDHETDGGRDGYEQRCRRQSSRFDEWMRETVAA